MLLREKPMQIKKHPSSETSIIIKKKKKKKKKERKSDLSVFLEQIDRDSSLERETFV